jgi:hypothetical protein
MDTTDDDDKRFDPRSNIFVIATLYGGGAPAPVRVRNMSRHGALVEAAALPPIGTPVRLCRGSLSVTGEVMWVDEGKAGLHFGSMTSVGEWLPGGKRGIGQQMADELVHQARLGEVPALNAAANIETEPCPMSVELQRYAAELEQAGGELAADAEIAGRYAASLQAIDGVAQALAKLAAGEPSRGAVVTPIRSRTAP